MSLWPEKIFKAPHYSMDHSLVHRLWLNRIKASSFKTHMISHFNFTSLILNNYYMSDLTDILAIIYHRKTVTRSFKAITDDLRPLDLLKQLNKKK